MAHELKRTPIAASPSPPARTGHQRQRLNRLTRKKVHRR